MSHSTDRNVAAATRICEGWHTLDLAAYRELFADDVEYRNMPLPDVVRGPDQVFKTLRPVRTSFDVQLRIDRLVAEGDVVSVERTEHFVPKDGARPPFDLPVLGIFEFRDGKIAAWRDYFDMKQFQGEG